MTMNITAASTPSSICVIFGAGAYYSTPVIPDEAFVVAADGGLDHARELSIPVDVIIGDFDSLTGAPPEPGERTIALPAEKDDPDMLSALKIGWSHGCRIFHIYGGLGGRIDHTIANIQLMTHVSRHGGIGFLHGDDTVITAITDGELRFPANEVAPGRMVSVFSATDESLDVNEPGLKYQLSHATMTNSHVNGVSNEFLKSTPSAINVHHGTLIVTFPAEAPLPDVVRFHEFSGDLGPLDTTVSSVLSAGVNAHEIS